MKLVNCNKRSAVDAEFRGIHGFLEYLRARGVVLGTWHPNGETLVPAQINIEHAILESLGIDPVELEKERAFILKVCQDGVKL